MDDGKEIKVSCSSSADSKTFYYTYFDVGLRKGEWGKLTEDEKKEKIQNLLDSEPEQPYWTVANIHT